MDANFTCKEDDFFEEDLDGVRCFFALTGLALYNIKFWYICFSLLLLLLFISIFGGIKEDYRWFILNQVIWDALMTFDFMCNNEISNFYQHDSYYHNRYISRMFEGVKYASFSSFTLLSLSRFLCLYFNNFYEKLIKGYRIFAIFDNLLYNFVFIITNLGGFFNWLAIIRLFNILCPNRAERDDFECLLNPPENFTLEFFKTVSNILNDISKIIPPICSLVLIISTIMIIIKIAKQFKFQSKTIKKDFYISVRITVVIAFQTLLYNFICIIEIANKFFIDFYGHYLTNSSISEKMLVGKMKSGR